MSRGDDGIVLKRFLELVISNYEKKGKQDELFDLLRDKIETLRHNAIAPYRDTS
jgi:hypothetical protein